jgi:hypothetical protein
LVALLLIAGPALAEPAQAPPPAPRIEGRFGFDVLGPKPTCAKLTGALLAKLTRSDRCVQPDNGGQTGPGSSSSRAAR